MVTPVQLREAALRYAELGYRVFPCSPNNKTPLTARGFHDATADASTIERWWTQNPRANIGIATEGLLVVDIDGEQNPWPNDPERAADLTDAGAVALTPRGGKHYFYRRPLGRHWRCSAGQLAQRVDVRTDGGYVVVSPSQTDHGRYRWAPGLELDAPPVRLPEPPAWLSDQLDRLSSPPPKPQLASAGNQGEGAPIPDGQRNATLARLAGAMRRVGMGQAEIMAALREANRIRCRPPLADAEVARIAMSISRYPPDQLVASVPDATQTQSLEPVSLADLLSQHQCLRSPLVHGLLRAGETMNVIASPKTGKSWLTVDLALAVATGRSWLDLFPCERGRVLVIDNELHGETTAHRIRQVMAARGITVHDCGDRLEVAHLRGRLMDIFALAGQLVSSPVGKYQMIVLDAFYRFLPREVDENDNGAMAQVYNVLDALASKLQCAFVLIHHTTKGSQAGKAVTDVGAGAGAQSRAADAHLVLRPADEPGVAVLEAAVRSWPPLEPKRLRWSWPVWTVDRLGQPSRTTQRRDV